MNGIELWHGFPRDKFRAAKCFGSAVSDIKRGASRIGDLQAGEKGEEEEEEEEDKIKLEVGCYSGRKADERPVRFRLVDCQYMVEDILDQWYGPHDASYKVRADDGNLYILRRETSTPDGPWHLVSFLQLLRES